MWTGRRPADTRRMSRSEAPPSAAPTSRKSITTLLIVEDSATIRRALVRTLQGDVPRILEAKDGQEGLVLAADVPAPDAVLLDLNLPDMDGVEVCRQLRSMPATARIPIIILTGTPNVETLQSAMRAGANDFLAKPFSGAHLRTRIRRWLPGWESISADLVVGSASRRGH